MSTNTPRVALFTDSYYEANGVARTANALEAFAAERDRPLLVVHGGRADQLIESGSVARLELRRWRRTSFVLDHDLQYDLALWRQARRVRDVLRWFRPDVLHFTGPSDVGQLGAYLGHRLGVPIVGSWHTNLHEYASRRLLKHCSWMREGTRMPIRGINTLIGRLAAEISGADWHLDLDGFLTATELVAISIEPVNVPRV
jgi:hypothetical protein